MIIHDGPRSPVNVRIERSDGTVVPLECAYIGLEDGIHAWEAVLTVPVNTPGDNIAMDALPPKTAVRLSVLGHHGSAEEDA